MVKKTCFFAFLLFTRIFAFEYSNGEIASKSPEIIRKFYGNDQVLDQFIENHSWNHYWQVQVEGRVFYIDQTKDIIKQHLNNGSPYEVYNFEYLWRYTKPGTTAIDIGAHVGTHTVDLSRFVGEAGHVVAFEPQCKIFAELAINLHLNQCTNVSLHRMALGDSQGVVTMSAPNEHNEGGIAIGSGGDTVPMNSLDSFHFNDVSVIKIDVEGFEERVLAGAIETIQRNRPVILLEIMGGASREAASERVASIFKWMKNIGYVGKYLVMCDYVFFPKEGIALARGDKYSNFIVKEYQ